MSLQFCAAPGCPALVTKGRCPVHSVQKEHDRYNYEIRRWYRTARWRRIRDQVLREANHTCVDCHGTFLNLDVDHEIPHRGDPELFWNVANLKARCVSCHATKTGRGL